MVMKKIKLFNNIKRNKKKLQVIQDENKGLRQSIQTMEKRLASMENRVASIENVLSRIDDDKRLDDLYNVYKNLDI